MKAVAALISHFLLSHEQGTFIKDTFYYNEGKWEEKKKSPELISI